MRGSVFTIIWFYRKSLLERVCAEGDLSNREQFSKFISQLKSHECLQSIYTDQVPLQDIVGLASIEFPQFHSPGSQLDPPRRAVSASGIVQSFRQQYKIDRDVQQFFAIGWLLFHHNKQINTIRWGHFRSCTANDLSMDWGDQKCIWNSIERKLFT
mmetsp:Transcript_3254/g.7857  ORF Transcript_3254/g.7857 Transcript_3254/m.7857 type:complete len:156 (-) Transcript_3254:87-554(-)